MPLRPRRLSARAGVRHLRHPDAWLLVIALLMGTALPTSVVGTGAAVAPEQPAHAGAALGWPTTQAAGASTAPSPPTAEVTGVRRDSAGRHWSRADVAGSDAVGIDPTVVPYRIEPPASASAAPVVPTARAWTGRFNLYRAGTFVTQKRFTWCVAASVQMMVNIVRHHTDRTSLTQATMIAYAQRKDQGPYGEGGGTDVTGWTTALRHFGAGKYRAVGSNTAAGALRLAAIAMRQTGRPAGILVMEGRHAWVLHGFESRTDPRRDPRAWIRAVRISGPLYPVQQKGGYDPRPNTRLSVKALARWFQPSTVGALAGKYVVVIPTH
jgi:hypothetical protein